MSVETPAADVSAVLPRHFQILKENHGFSNNKASTSRYTPLNCFPLFLVEQFHPIHSFTNLYYLFIGALQLIPAISFSHPMARNISIGFPITWVNVGILLIQETVQKLIEDSAKHRADHRMNSQKVSILRDGAFNENGTWGEVVVGDVVMIMDRECFPADLLLLRCADPLPGQAWVNTKPLDGESDTKLRLAPKQTVELLAGVEPQHLANKLEGSMYVEAPNDKVNDFMGQLCLAGREPLLVTQQNMLLRGCQLRATDWVYGLVVSTGKQTKIDFATGHGSKPKRSTTVRKLHKHVLIILGIIAVLSILGASISLLFFRGDYDYWYVEGQCGEDRCIDATYWAQTWGSYVLVLYLYIPTTLIVTLPFIQLFQCSFMSSDVDMYDETVDEPCAVGNATLCDELGQISHIFSDKTGTLTANHMEFRRCVIGGVAYGCGDTAISRTVRGAVAPPPLRPPPPAAQTMRKCSSSFVSFEEAADAPSLFELIARNDAAAAAAHEFFLAMAINHSVTIEDVKGEQELAASSPDEQAFVAAAELFGFEYLSRDTFEGVVRLRQRANGAMHEVGLLEVFPYESSRKRMSVLVQLPPALLSLCGGGGATRLYVKGADSIMLTLLQPGSEGADPEKLNSLEALLSEWAEIALRTLVWAKKEVSNYDAWAVEYATAKASPEEQQNLKLGKPSKITDLQRQMESDLVLQGASAIEDKLQDGVPEILRDLRTAGIKVWMLTGDKVGTAMNIARACNILPLEAEIIEFTCDSFPVLNELSTAEMLAVQQKLDSFRAAAAERERGWISRLIGYFKEGQGVAVSTASKGAHIVADNTPMRRYRRRKGRQSLRLTALSDEEAAFEREVARQTKLLDTKHPQLKRARDVLTAHMEKLVLKFNAADDAKAIAGADGLKAADVEAGADGKHDRRPDRIASVTSPFRDVCLILDEKAIEYFGTLCKPVLTEVANVCRSVVACRARKDQKAQMLNMIRYGVPGSCCLAIGDGANDVAMIKAGHIGVGIIGKEGREALNASDFGIGQFRFLRSLLLVHGRNNYRRLSIFIYFTLYKNMVNATTMWFYSMLTAASATLLWPSIISDFLAPAVFTVLPILAYPLFDTDVPKHVAAHSPLLYTPGIAREYYTDLRLYGWIAEAMYAAMLCAYIPSLGLRNSPNDTVSSDSLSLAALWACCFTSYARLSFEIHSWTVVEVFSLVAMVAFLAMMTPLMSLINGPAPDNTNAGFSWSTLNGTMSPNFTQASWYFMLVLTVAGTVLPKMIVTANKVVKFGSHERWQENVAKVHNKAKEKNAQERIVRRVLRDSVAATANGQLYGEGPSKPASQRAGTGSRPTSHHDEGDTVSHEGAAIEAESSVYSVVMRRNEGIAQDDFTTKQIWNNYSMADRRESRTSREIRLRAVTEVSIEGTDSSKRTATSAYAYV